MTSLLIFATDSQKDKLNRLHSIETYEIQPGILVMPTYSDAGEVCKIVLEKRHVSSKGVDVEAKMSHEEILRIFDELAPRAERGKPKWNLGESGELTSFDGGTFDTTIPYENVSLMMFGKGKMNDAPGYVAAIIQWERQNCSHVK
jgi:hypothetical protein